MKKYNDIYFIRYVLYLCSVLTLLLGAYFFGVYFYPDTPITKLFSKLDYFSLITGSILFAGSILIFVVALILRKKALWHTNVIKMGKPDLAEFLTFVIVKRSEFVDSDNADRGGYIKFSYEDDAKVKHEVRSPIYFAREKLIKIKAMQLLPIKTLNGSAALDIDEINTKLSETN